MSIRVRPISLVSPLFLAVLSVGISAPAFASGDDKPAPPATSNATATSTASAAAATTPKPDHAKKIYTNDDVDRMWPKTKGLMLVSYSSQPPAKPAPQPKAEALPPEKDPLWYAQQVAALTAALDQATPDEERLREFRISNSTTPEPGVRYGLGIYAPCEGITTDNRIAQLATARAEIEQQLAALENTARENGMPSGTLRDAPEILAAAEKPLTPAERRLALSQEQARLQSGLADTQNELASMSDQAASLRATLQQPTPGYGGNMTTNLIQNLDHRSAEIRAALDQIDDAARQMGASQQ